MAKSIRNYISIGEGCLISMGSGQIILEQSFF